MRLFRPDPIELRSLYERHNSVPAVAAELGVAYETARRWLLAAGVVFRPKGRPSQSAEGLDSERIAERYLAGESIAALGAAFDVSPTTIGKRLRDAGVELRARPGWNT